MESSLQDFIRGVTAGNVDRVEAIAWIRRVHSEGLSLAETAELTIAMADSGERLSWPESGGALVDKHSTGGVGDKVSLVLAPLWAEMGFRVPMLSGRGLGITGGTLDKLESIPGFRTDLDSSRLGEVLESTGCFINGQTASLAPADRVLYALRNETDTIDSIPLITSSILSKKLAEGTDRLVMDVKHGSGAFMKTKDQAHALGESIRNTGEQAGLVVEVHLTPMDQPLGLAVGNALEVEEAVVTLKGAGPEDLVDLVARLSGNEAGAREVLGSGAAFERFERMVRAQGGNLDAGFEGDGCEEILLGAPVSGRVLGLDARGIGQAVFTLGAGRKEVGDALHPGVGMRLLAKEGDLVEAGEPWAVLLHAGKGVEEAESLAQAALEVG